MAGATGDDGLGYGGKADITQSAWKLCSVAKRSSASLPCRQDKRRGFAYLAFPEDTTWYPCSPAPSMARCTKPDALASSTNSLI